MDSTKKRLIVILAWILLAAISFFIISGMASSEKLGDDTRETQQYLNEKRSDVLKLAGASAGVAVTISALPNDMGSPLADQLGKIAGYMTVVLTAIYLEKALAAFSGIAAFKILFPIAFLLLALFTWKRNQAVLKIATKILVLALAVSLVVPVSVEVSKMIENTTVLVQESQEQVTNSGKKDNNDDAGSKIATKVSGTNKGKNGIFTSIVDGVTDKANALKEKAEATLGKGKDKYNEIKEEAIDTVKSMVEQVAIMIITSCVLPLLVLVFLLWLLKMFMNTDLIGKYLKIEKDMKTES